MKKRKITFRVSEEEYNEIISKAEKFKYSTVSEYCRHVSLLSEIPSVTYVKPEKHIQIKWNKEKMQDFVKCKEDPVYFIKQYCLNLRLYQEEAFEEFLINNSLIMVGPRRSGLTTLTCCYILHELIFKENINVILINRDSNSCRNSLDIIKKMYTDLPNHFKTGAREWNKSGIVLENNSKLMTSHSYISACCGYNADLLVWENYGYNSNIETLKSYLPSLIDTNGKMIIVNTGVNVEMSSLWVEKNFTKKFNRYRIDYKDIDAYKSYDFENNIKSILGKDVFDNEYKLTSLNLE